MKKKFIYLLLLIFLVTGCNNSFLNNKKSNENLDNNINNNEKVSEEQVLNINVVINNKTYSVSIEDNETTKEFLDMLPLTLKMNDLNNNEKYYYLDKSLKTNSYNPKTIKSGDVMLYGNNCLVVFYDSFKTSYSYTKIGHIENMPKLDSNTITISFEK